MGSAHDDALWYKQECARQQKGNFGERFVAHARALEAKRNLDDALAALEKAEKAFIVAQIECDRVDGIDR